MRALFRKSLFIYLLCIPLFAGAIDVHYPQQYFRNPLNIPILLAGNFGECRPGHFHSGIDIKTQGRENLPVFAAADGYISRIKMEPGGFGHGLYITHPNGYTTLYAHLNHFVPALQQYVRKQQYAKQSWTVDLSFTPDQFPVEQGQQIAFSGNTGGSTAPHLHFEIRDTKTEHPLNPQLFGLDIHDTRAPVPLQVALYSRPASIYRQVPALFPLSNRQGIYKPANDTLYAAKDSVGLGIVVNDYMDGSDNTLAYYTAAWYADDILQGRIRLDDIGYDETRYLHAFADYKTKQNDGPWVQCLFRLPGNELTRIYESLNDAQGIFYNEREAVAVKIVLTDAAGNNSEVRFWLRQAKEASIAACGGDGTAGPGKRYTYEHSNCSFYLDGHQLYDAVCAETIVNPGDGLSQRFTILRPDIPAHHSFELSIKPDKALPFTIRNKIALAYTDGKELSGKAAVPQDKGWYKASVRNFGDYYLVADTAPPVVKQVAPVRGNLSKANRLAFIATDAITSVKTFRGELDGAWLLFEQHGNQWFYEMDAHCAKGPHRLVITATDENGNATRQVFNFSR